MLKILSPMHGAVVNRRHGKQTRDGLTIDVTGVAPAHVRVTVNGIAPRRSGDTFAATVTLTTRENEIVAAAAGPGGAQQHRIRVLWDRNSKPRYRFSIDDNSFCLRDIAAKQYPSLFDCFYFRVLRDLHAKYGTKFVLNIYYTTGDEFTLPSFPDRYRGEWQANADWLKLSFHAYANLPDRPYQYATPAKLAADFDVVHEQIIRFAGEATWSPPTVIHWGMLLPAALPVLAARGVKVLSGFFRLDRGIRDVHYFLDEQRCEYLSRNEALMDFDSGIVFSTIDLVCNCTPVDGIVPALAPLAADPATAEIMDLFTHEQYFWPFYENYLPDHAQRLDAALRFCTEHGYEPVFFHEGFPGAP